MLRSVLGSIYVRVDRFDLPQPCVLDKHLTTLALFARGPLRSGSARMVPCALDQDSPVDRASR